MRDDDHPREIVPFEPAGLHSDQSRAIAAADPRAVAVEGQLRDFAKPLLLLKRARDLARRLETAALIAEQCGWPKPNHPTGKKARECMARWGKERRRAARLLRGLETKGDCFREAMRLAADGELNVLGDRLKAAIATPGADLIAESFALMLATAPGMAAPSPLYAESAVLLIADCAPSIGALVLALDDCARAEDRNYGRAPSEFEIEAALERRETDFEDWGDALKWFAENEAEFPAIIAREQAKAQEAERQRVAAEAKAAEIERRRLIRNAAAAMRANSLAAPADFAPDILFDARALLVAEAASHAETLAQAKADAERQRAEIHGRIAVGDFRFVRWPHCNNFDAVADAFELDPTSTPEQITALQLFRRKEAPTLATAPSSMMRRPFPRS